MEQNPESDETQERQGSSLNRREFMRRTAALGLSAGALALFEAACSSVEPLLTMEPPAASSAIPTQTPTLLPPESVTKTAPPARSRVLTTATPSPSLAQSVAQSASQTVELPAGAPASTATPSPSPAQSVAQSASQIVDSPAGAPASTATPDQSPLPAVRQVSLSDKRLQIGHLLRRAGFGAGREEYERFVDLGVADTVDYLIEYQQVDDSALETRLDGLGFDLEKLAHLQQWALLRMIYTKRPLQEKMVLFWHGLLTSAFKKVGAGPYMLNQDRLFREQALGDYDVLLKAVSRDPAMLIWLDSRVNKKSAPNENFSRELMELFSTGPGPYTEKDVRESARSFTGYRLRRKVFEFDPKLHDNFSKTFLNASGYFDGDQIIDIIMNHPATGDFMCTKLFSFFAYDSPDQTVISRLASIFRSSNFSVRKVVKEILLSPEFYSYRAYRVKIKSPPELVAGTVRSLGIEADGKQLNRLTTRMGMSLFNPFDVSGWAGGATWINSTTLLQRINFANRVSTAKSGRFSPDLKALVQERKISSVQEGLSYFLLVLLDDNISEEEHKILFSFAQNLDAMEENGAMRTLDEKLRTLLYLVLASPDYQLA